MWGTTTPTTTSISTMSRRKQATPRHLDGNLAEGEQAGVTSLDESSNDLVCGGCRLSFGLDSLLFHQHRKTCNAVDETSRDDDDEDDDDDGEGEDPPPNNSPPQPPLESSSLASLKSPEKTNSTRASIGDAGIKENRASAGAVEADTEPDVEMALFRHEERRSAPSTGHDAEDVFDAGVVARPAPLEPPRKLARRNESPNEENDDRRRNGDDNDEDDDDDEAATTRICAKRFNHFSPFSSNRVSPLINNACSNSLIMNNINKVRTTPTSATFSTNQRPRKDSTTSHDDESDQSALEKNLLFASDEVFQQQQQTQQQQQRQHPRDDDEDDDGDYQSLQQQQQHHLQQQQTKHPRKQKTSSIKRSVDEGGALDFRRRDDDDDDNDDDGEEKDRFSPAPPSPIPGPAIPQPHPDLPHALAAAAARDLPGSPLSASAASPPLNLAGNVTLEPMENTKVAMAQFAEKTALLLRGLGHAAPPGDIDVLQSTLTQLQRQQLVQLQIIQQLQHSLVTGALLGEGGDANHAKQMAATLAALQSLPLLANFPPPPPSSIAALDPRPRGAAEGLVKSGGDTRDAASDESLVDDAAAKPYSPQQPQQPAHRISGLGDAEAASPRSAHAEHDDDEDDVDDGVASPRPLASSPAPPPPQRIASNAPSPGAGANVKDGAAAVAPPGAADVGHSPLEMLQQTTATFNALSSLEKKFKGMFEGIPTYNEKSPIGLNPETAAALHRSVSDDPYYKHRCRICNKAFGSESALQIHIRSHTASTMMAPEIPDGDRDAAAAAASPRSASPSRGLGRGVFNGAAPLSHPHFHPGHLLGATSPAAAAEGGHLSADPRRFSLGGSLGSVNLQKSPTTAASTADRKSPDITGKAATSSSSPFNGIGHPHPGKASSPPSSSHASTPLSVDTSFANGNPINHPLTENVPCISPNAPLEKYMEISTPETSKLQQLVDNIENKLADPNQCCICNRILSCKSALQMHYRTHTGERPFRCKLCGRAFTTKGNLKTHMGVHKAKPPLRVLHQCPVCHKQFTNAIVLQQHIRLHTGEISEEQERNIRESLSREDLKEIYPQIPQLPPHGFLPGFMGLPLPGGLDLRAALQSQASLASMAAAGLDLTNASIHQDSNDEEEAGIDLSQKKQLAITSADHVKTEDERNVLPMSPCSEPEKNDHKSIDNQRIHEEKEQKLNCHRNEEMAPPASNANHHNSAISTSLVALENTVKGISAGAQHSALSFYKSQFGFNPFGIPPKMPTSETNLKSPVDMRMPSPTRSDDHKGEDDGNIDSKPVNHSGETRSDRSDASSPYTVASEGRSANSDPCIPPSPAASEGGALDLTPRSSSGHYATAFRDAIEAGHMPNHPISSLGSLIPPPPPSGLFPPLGASPYPGTLPVPGLTGGSRNTTCDICFKTFACRSALEIHYRSHTKERPFKCEICERAFSTRGNMKQHMLTHKIRDIPSKAFSEEDYESSKQTNENGSGNNSPEQFNDKNDNDGLYDKPLALTPASPQSSLASAPSPSHGGFSLPPPPQFPTTSLPSSLRSLAFPGMPSSLPPESSGLVPSTTSGATSSRHSSGTTEGSSGSNNSNRQKQTPSNRQCQVCHKYFSSASAVQIHMRTHTGEKPFKCTICSRAFTTKGNLKVHMGTHMWNNGPSRRGRRMSVDVPFGAVPPGHPGVLPHPRLPKENMFPPGHPGAPGAPGPDARGIYPPGALRGFPPASVADFYHGYPLGLVNGIGPKLNEISVIQSLNGANAMNRFNGPNLLSPPAFLRGDMGSHQRPLSQTSSDEHGFNNNEINLSTKKSNRSEPSTSPRDSYNHSPRSRSSSPEPTNHHSRQRSISPTSRKRPRSISPPPPVLDLPKPLSPGNHLGFPLFPVPPAMANSWASLWKAHSEASAANMAAAAAAAVNASATDLSARKSSTSPLGYESRERSRSRSPAPTRSPNLSPLHHSAPTLTATTSISSTGATRSPGSSGSPGSSPNPGAPAGVASRHPRDSPPSWRMWKPSHEMKQVS